ncbi:PALD protein, partial [Eudromia elegans]|nr:PALD protein [Eudromia elegans]
VMGTTASTAQQTVAAAARGLGAMEEQRSPSVPSFQAAGLHNSKAKSIITNKVAPVVITYNCREEFQIHDELLKADYAVGRIAEGTPEHYLVQGKYFLVRDVSGELDTLNTTGSCGAPNFRQAKGGHAVFGMGQPSLNGFRQVLQKIQKEGHKECVFFCVREEPVVFLPAEGDFVPYTPRARENLRESPPGLQSGLDVEGLELAIRREVPDAAGGHVPGAALGRRGREDVRVTREVYGRPVFTQPAYRYHRLPLPAAGAPLEAQIDAFMQFLRSPDVLLLREPGRAPPALLFGCQTGAGRTNLAMAMGTLVLLRRAGAAPKLELAQAARTPPRERPRVVQAFIEMVPKGQQMVEEVDGAIACCSEMHDVREAIYEHQKRLEGPGQDRPPQGGSTEEDSLQRSLQSLERYFYLILFNYYLHEQHPLGFALSFSRWMCRHAELYRLLARGDAAELSVTAEQLAEGTRVLVADERSRPDVLGTVKEMSVANFRRVPKMPVYGTAQPSSKALGTVLRYLTDGKRRHSRVLWVNLREEVVLDGHEQVYTLREPGSPEELLTVPACSPEQLEKLEATLKSELLKSQKWLEVYLEAEKQMKLFKSCLTTQEVFNQHKGTCQGLTYRRIPIPDFCAPEEQDFDRLLEAMKSSLAEDSRAAFVFNCHSGRGRTTTAMVIAVLTLWHFHGIPEMSEDEIVSVPDAKYTKGEFEVVMEVVQLLPDGHRMKKEVDTALDTVSETMTPMHYHLREIIICTYRQGKAAKEERERQILQLRSLQYLERYIYLILFNAYLHLEKKDSWQRPFSAWMRQVAAGAGVYELLDRLGFGELERAEGQALRRLRHR